MSAYRPDPKEDGRRPAFAEGYPRTPELDAIVRAFAEGDYARVRREAPALAAKAESDEVRRAAAELEARTRADPLAKVFFALTAALLVILSAWWLARNGPAPSPPPVVERIK